ncbi:ornithine cyclodeaminase/mu-crystallin family protein [Candidatus Vecturithrix granuli]|uniref:Ornithine cyclodeaminase/mu-crystallin family protein n=1 Tax=Vecturithrix granuli TaxID=1499967 RepID=A0A081BXP2_VECG1|nr:ornithine cyclodeaminase/mu-crystallin family protein [Candidatus Vecturithrix granuli]
MPFRVLSAKDIKQALPMKQAIEAMKKAFVLMSANQAIVPPRIHLDLPENHGATLTMPVYIPELKQIGLKFLSLFGENPQYDLPTIQAIVLVIDAVHGTPLALMDGAVLTALRTGAGSGAATDLLARQDARVAAIFGAGAQGRTQLEAVCAVRPLERAYIFDANLQTAERFAQEMSAHLHIAVDVPTSQDVLSEADIICTATTASTPIFADTQIKTGVHINAIGSYKPHIREIPGETVARAKVVVDHRPSCLKEAGDILIPMQAGLFTEDHIAAELGELILAEKPGRSSGQEVTLYKSVGNAVQDLVAASDVLKEAESLNLGTIVEL